MGRLRLVSPSILRNVKSGLMGRDHRGRAKASSLIPLFTNWSTVRAGKTIQSPHHARLQWCRCTAVSIVSSKTPLTSKFLLPGSVEIARAEGFGE